MKPRLITCIIAVALLGVFSGAVLALPTDWTMFRQDEKRWGSAGQGTLGNAVGEVGRPVPIWIYPGPQSGSRVIDDADVAPEFTASPGWTEENVNNLNQYKKTFKYVPVTYEAEEKWAPRQAPFAEWVFDNVSDGSYTISTWFPSWKSSSLLPMHSKDAHFYFEAVSTTGETVSGVYTLDQRVGNTWLRLSYDPIILSPGGTWTITVTLTNQTHDEAGAVGGSVVIADAVRIEGTKGTIYSSPVASKVNKYVLSCATANKMLPRTSMSGLITREVGEITAIGTEPDSGIDVPGKTDDRGFPAWTYPGNTNWIAGGISATPTITTTTSYGEIAVVPAEDGMVYVIRTGNLAAGEDRLIWQGPGYISDENVGGSNVTYTLPADWLIRNPAMGGYRHDPLAIVPAGYRITPTVPRVTDLNDLDDVPHAEWRVNVDEPRRYAVYAWIPFSTNNELFAYDARYLLEGGSDPDTYTRVNQSEGGKWQLIGYREVENANTNITVTLYADSWVVGGYVAADAIKVVPADIGSFEFSSPIVQVTIDPVSLSEIISVYACSTSGRVYKLQVGEHDPVWTYPDTDEYGIGAIYATPAFTGSALYVGSSDGRVYSLSTGGSKRWIYPDQDKSFGQISSTSAVDDGGDPIIYVAIGAWGSSGFDFNTSGRVVALRETTAPEGRLIVNEDWWFPDKDENSKGSFMYSSPLYMNNWRVGGPNGLFIGSTDGSFYGINAGTGHGLVQPAGPWEDPNDAYPYLGSSMYSSAAGTILDHYWKREAPGSSANVPMAFIGTQGSRIYGVDLDYTAGGTQNARKDWWWTLYGRATSSPALYDGRMYVCDTAGYTWAFSTRGWNPLDGVSAEGWNLDIGAEPEWDGSEGDGGDATPEVDCFTIDKFQTLLTQMKDSEGTGNNVTFDDDLHTLARGEPPPSPETFIYEWGEDICIIVWNLMDENTAVTMKMKSEAPGDHSDAEETEDKPFQRGYYLNSTGEQVFYAAFKYELNGSAGNKTQTPGSKITISVIEKPGKNADGKNRGSSDEIPVPKHPLTGTEPAQYKRQSFQINNPLGLMYDDQGLTNANDRYIGVDDTTGLTRRGSDMAGINGNSRDVNGNIITADSNLDPPYIRAMNATHNTTTSPIGLVVCDRSLMGAYGRQITRFRVDRRDLAWRGGYVQAKNPIWEWEDPPPESGAKNSSLDYPDIPARQFQCTMLASKMDPAQTPVELMTPVYGAIPDPMTNDFAYPAGFNGMGTAVSVPRFQPANPKDDPIVVNTMLEPQLRGCGYSGNTFLFVDSNGNGKVDRPGELGISGTVRWATAEAYREVHGQVLVAPEQKVEIAEKTIDIGQAPHGFGYTLDANDLPAPFNPTLVDDPIAGIAPITGLTPTTTFGEWFKPFTAYNVGNTNLVNLSAKVYYQTFNAAGVPSGGEGLISDTVQEPLNGILGTGHILPGSGVCEFSTLDRPQFINLALNPLWYPVLTGVNTVTTPQNWLVGSRTFHKPRVGEPPSVLRMPDLPTRLYQDMRYTYLHFADLDPNTKRSHPRPTVSVAAPLGQPVGNYTGAFVLQEGGSMPPVSNVVPLTISVTESRMTDAATPGVRPQIDNPDAVAGWLPSGDMAPAAYRDPVNNNLYLFWPSSRYGPTLTGNAEASPADPWYLHVSKLPWDDNANKWVFAVDTSAEESQWWTPTVEPSGGPGTTFPPADAVSTFFPGPGDIVPNSAGNPASIKFSSPSATTNGAGNSWLLFSGQTYKKTDTTLDSNALDDMRSMVYYTDITDGNLQSSDVYTITKDWTMPKFGIRGAADIWNNVERLWAFWYGGTNDKWRIYYTLNPNVTGGNAQDNWRNEAQLPISKDLTSASEPSPISFGMATGRMIDVAYTGYSTFHKNSDIYLSRYQWANSAAAPSKGGHWPVSTEKMPLWHADLFQDSSNGDWYPQLPDDDMLAPTLVPYNELRRDLDRSAWYSRDTDWDPNERIHVYVFPDRNDLTVSCELTKGTPTKDRQTGAWVYTYEDASDPVQVTLRTNYRAVIVDLASGSVKFMRDPGNKAKVVATYSPRAYRLTYDSTSDMSPFVLLDRDPNPRYQNLVSNPFVPDGAPRPANDRLWLFWRRTIDKTGSGIYYKTFRAIVPLDRQMAIDNGTGKPSLTMPGRSDLLPAVEVDWAKNRLYFPCNEVGSIAKVEYEWVDSTGTVQDITEFHRVELAEEIGTGDSVFGLTKVIMNEGQVCAFKDPVLAENKMWVFWTSARSGITDLYYETISPKFY